jgi:hypothetical protein
MLSTGTLDIVIESQSVINDAEYSTIQLIILILASMGKCIPYKLVTMVTTPVDTQFIDDAQTELLVK